MAEPGILKRVVRWVDAGKDIALHEGMRLLPTPAVSALGSGIALLASRFRLKGQVARSARALSHLRPELDEAARHALAVANLRNIGRSYAEFSCLHRAAREGRIVVEGRENITAPNAVLALLHLGNWEAGMVVIDELGLRIRSIYQPPASATQLAIAMRVRRSLKNDAIRGDAMALREALRVLARGDTMVGVFVDEYKGGRVNAPAFGRAPAARGNIAMAARLALRAGVPLVPAYMTREPGPRFRAHFLPPVPLGGDPVADQAAIEAVIEPVVRRHLDQWLMLSAFRPDR
jgi:KDO2-lipid IV(A) lauroyltransferase